MSEIHIPNCSLVIAVNKQGEPTAVLVPFGKSINEYVKRQCENWDTMIEFKTLGTVHASSIRDVITIAP